MLCAVIVWCNTFNAPDSCRLKFYHGTDTPERIAPATMSGVTDAVNRVLTGLPQKDLYYAKHYRIRTYIFMIITSNMNVIWACGPVACHRKLSDKYVVSQRVALGDVSQ